MMTTLTQPSDTVARVDHPLRTVIVGAGEAGRALARDLRRVDAFGLEPIGFLDDDVTKKRVRHLPVLGRLEDLLAVITAEHIDAVVIAIPGLPWETSRRLAATANRVGVKVRFLPSFIALLHRDVVGTDMRDLQTGALIGRPELHLVSAATADMIRDRRVLVTGAGGSIGSELCRQLRGFGPAQLLMVDHDESNLLRLQLELNGSSFDGGADVVVGDIRDAGRMEQIMWDHRPHLVFHAAALKHLPMLEGHPCEGVKSNVMGTHNVVQAAIDHGVERFVLISTDKAADPTSVLGATKQLAELITKAAAGSATVVSAVRFGNVLGSRGSLLTVLSQQMRSGCPVTITHPEVSRYFMTIEEAVGLVLEAAHMAVGGETFVLDMGSPVRIVDLVENYARHLNIDTTELDIRFTGLQKGEKLHEVLFSDQEVQRPTTHPRIFGALPPTVPPQFRAVVHRLYNAAQDNRSHEVTSYLSELVPTYAPPQDGECSGTNGHRAAPYPDDY
ncbi:MAG: nucleoside-diphosphate sugar epimerase/dehydratase [Ornithinimicrobium sp.]